MSKYLSLNYYDGTLEGVQENYFRENGLPVDKYLSPGGLSTLKHHWTEGLGGPGDITPDVFVGTGERYPQGVYGNLYVPQSHSAVNQVYKGPHTELTEKATLHGRPYYWDQSTPSGPVESVQVQDTQVQSTFQQSTPLLKSPSSVKSTRKSGKKGIEGFTTKNIGKDGEFELLSAENTRAKRSVETDVTDLGIDTTTFYFSLTVMCFAFVVAGFWHDSLRKFAEQYLNNGRGVTWQKNSLYAIGLSVLFLGFLKVFKVSKISQ